MPMYLRPPARPIPTPASGLTVAIGAVEVALESARSWQPLPIRCVVPFSGAVVRSQGIAGEQ